MVTIDALIISGLIIEGNELKIDVTSKKKYALIEYKAWENFKIQIGMETKSEKVESLNANHSIKEVEK